MIHGLLPVFLVNVLGASTEVVGLIEGIGESTASISKLFSSWLSHRFGNRKVLTIVGYGLGPFPNLSSRSSPGLCPDCRFEYRFLVNLSAPSAMTALLAARMGWVER
jgi:hypothetical protein